MNLSVKKSIAIIIIAALIPIYSAYSKSIGVFLFNSILLRTDNSKIGQYISQITAKEDLILKNKNNNEELMYEIKNKSTDLDLSIKSLRDTDQNLVLQSSKKLNQYASKNQDLDQKLNSLKDNIKIDVKKHDYASLVNHMDSVINLQNLKYNLLKNADIDLDLALKSLK